MMLETVRKAINSGPCISFEEYFHEYVSSVQDTSIDLEMAFVFRNNFMNVNMMSRLIDTEYERLVLN